MRIKILGTIIEKTKLNKTNYAHETASMILNNLSSSTSTELHQKKKFFRTITFSNIYITHNEAKIYICGEDKYLLDFINNIKNNNMIRVDDMVIVINHISEMPNLQKKQDDVYLFKSKVIINVFNKELNKNQLADIITTEQRLVQNSNDKCKARGIEGVIKEVQLINPKTTVTKYKKGNIKAYKSIIKITGDYEAVQELYNIGLGENCFTSHGLLWEV